ncbi:MAG: cyclic nucleotide-binding domain-containing protein [Nitrospina sp.]|mgnify:FL=1|nr:cyclic nucleotide-binding domain-containing protein [Nitrospina sp.]MBT4104403.1 cyclic nucleotide-binding domain-containing protein [Nitrospina sp.]MBT4389928.1 cyclic nucleotide-binding domain-containing protein [Nitrospina sp.]MBT4621975.1 cyclic nucleotide-binding domain-containing protein [Nitrospina sp.]MBT5028954.1 cyclic nucleotide-binding domain-containing protein [Nitrospina sp.]
MAEDINEKEFDWISEVFKKAEVFTGLSYDEREALINEMYKLSYKPEDIVFKEGDTPNACFLIYKGKAKVAKNKMIVLKKAVSTLGPGAFFGEMAFLTYAPRLATVTATKNLTCFVLLKSTFQRLLAKNPSFKKWLETLSAKRMVKLESI